jgi:predicted transposase YbfD/YdcC
MGAYEGDFFEIFGTLEDIRQEEKVKHKLVDILFLVVSAVICGCNEWKEIYMWANWESNVKWLKKYIGLENGIPSLATIGRLFNIINPKQFEKCFIDWMRAAVDLREKEVIAIDGKTMRGSQDRNQKGAHIVSALCSSYNLVIGQVKTEAKSNEITAIPELLDLLFIKGCIVTIDAMGTQKKIAAKIVKDNQADYVLNLKGNQETLYQEVAEYFSDLKKDGRLDGGKLKNKQEPVESILNNGILGTYRTCEKGHGRIENRTYYYSTDIDWMKEAKKEWEKLTGIGMVVREVDFSDPGIKSTVETAFYIGSIEKVKDFAFAVRNHWGIESMHWSLDVTFGDDENRVRKGMAPQNMAVLKRIAFNAVKKDTQKYPKQSMKARRFMAMGNPEYRDYLLDLNLKDR